MPVTFISTPFDMNTEIMNSWPQHGSAQEAQWKFSFKSLNKDNFHCLGVMSYLMPDDTPQALFELAPIHDDLPDHLEFLRDKFRYDSLRILRRA